MFRLVGCIHHEEGIFIDYIYTNSKYICFIGKKHIFAWYPNQTYNTCMYENLKKITYIQVLHLCIYTGKKATSS